MKYVWLVVQDSMDEGKTVVAVYDNVTGAATAATMMEEQADYGEHKFYIERRTIQQ